MYSVLSVMSFRLPRPDELWLWMSQRLLPYLHKNQSGQGSYSVTLGSPRLRQIRLQEGTSE